MFARLSQRAFPQAILLTALLSSLHIGCGAHPSRPVQLAGVCIDRMDAVPPSWQPPDTLHFPYSPLKWSPAEQAAADEAVASGLDEMAFFMKTDPKRITALWDNSVEAFIDTAYGASNRPNLAERALRLAHHSLEILAKPYLGEQAIEPTCSVVSDYLTLAVYAQGLAQRLPTVQGLEPLRSRLLAGANLAIKDCGDLKTLLGFDPHTAMANPNAPNGDVYGWVMWSVTFADALATPDLAMPTGTAEFIASTWRYMAQYPVPLPREHKGGMSHEAVYDGAYLMTHVAYMPTGYGRHPLHPSDAPWLYRYIRENYYAALELGELDLFAEFVDLLRQYGCSEHTDAQLRHGTRYLMHLYEKAGRRWMNHREPYEGKTVSDYDALHKPWTAIAGLRPRIFEPLVKNSYGAAFRRAIRGSKLESK